jgi:type III restriction enzyme
VKPVRPSETVRVYAVKEREALEIRFPRIEGYRVELPNERLSARFNADSKLELTPELVGPCEVLLEGIVGEGHTLDLKHLQATRPSTVTYHLVRNLLYRQFRDPGEAPPLHLFADLKRIARRWIDEGYLVCKGGTFPAQLLYQEIADMAGERIFLACQRSIEGEKRIKAIPDPYNPEGSSRFVNFTTSKASRWRTSPARCHVNWVVCDSDWEAEFALRALDRLPAPLPAGAGRAAVWGARSRHRVRGYREDGRGAAPGGPSGEARS